jgi:hypothetical protein
MISRLNFTVPSPSSLPRLVPSLSLTPPIPLFAGPWVGSRARVSEVRPSLGSVHSLFLYTVHRRRTVTIQFFGYFASGARVSV